MADGMIFGSICRSKVRCEIVESGGQHSFTVTTLDNVGDINQDVHYFIASQADMAGDKDMEQYHFIAAYLIRLFVVEAAALSQKEESA